MPFLLYGSAYGRESKIVSAVSVIVYLITNTWTWTWSTVYCPTWHNLRHFGGSIHSQSLDWYWQTKEYRKIYKL